MALGAQKRDVLRLVIGHGMLLTVIGITAGLLGAFVLTRWISTLLFGISPTDAVTFLGISLLIAFVSLAACYVPARKSVKLDPMIALRYE
jgi:ABC-type antimicrobial peptide transport system permease subunit